MTNNLFKGLIPLIVLMVFISGCQQLNSETQPATQQEIVALSPTTAATATQLPATATLPPPSTVILTAAPAPTDTPIPTDTPTETATVTEQPTAIPPTETATVVANLPTPTQGPFMWGEVIGSSSGGHPLEAFHLGYGKTHIMVIGGIHGGYEWNTILLTYELIDYLGANPAVVPDHVKLTFVPSANPDGQVLVTGQAGRFSRSQVSADTRPGRFNSNGVDLNRNWGCNWAADTYWGDRFVRDGGGYAPFSERESWTLRDYIVENEPELVIFLHSAAPGIFPGACNGVQVPDTLRLAEAYGAGSGYIVRSGGFNFYTITGESSDTLNLIGIPAFTVELNNHQDTDFLQNLGGLITVMDTPMGAIELDSN